MNEAAAVAQRRQTMLTVKDLGITFDTAQRPITAVQDLDLEVGDGEFVAIVGPSGCGKSTLLKALCGLLPISTGAVRIGVDGAGRRDSDLAVVFQEPRLMPWRTVLGNVAYPLEHRGLSRSAAKAAALREIEVVGLAGFEDAYPRQLSGGMQQRVNLARALVADPKVLLLDEPFAALDAQLRETMQAQLLRVWAETGKTALFVTHQVDEAVYLADRVVVFSPRPGRIKSEWTIDLPRPRPEHVKRSAEFHALEDGIWRDLERTGS